MYPHLPKPTHTQITNSTPTPTLTALYQYLLARALYSMHEGTGVSGFLGTAHQTMMFGASKLHKDTKNVGLESKVVATLGSEYLDLTLPPCGLPPCGSATPPILSALCFPAYGLQTMCGAIGDGREDGDVEMSSATTSLATHGNLGSSWRGAFLRGRNRIYTRGGSICDHRIGSREWVESLQSRHGVTLQDCWAMAAAGCQNLEAWNALTLAQRNGWRNTLNN